MSLRSKLIKWLGGISGEGMVPEESAKDAILFFQKEWEKEKARLTFQMQVADSDRRMANRAARDFQIRMQQQAEEIRMLRETVARLQFWQHPPHQSPQTATQVQFTQDEIASMIRLCHPDKHGNSEAANRITKSLLKARK